MCKYKIVTVHSVFHSDHEIHRTVKAPMAHIQVNKSFNILVEIIIYRTGVQKYYTAQTVIFKTAC